MLSRILVSNTQITNYLLIVTLALCKPAYWKVFRYCLHLFCKQRIWNLDISKTINSDNTLVLNLNEQQIFSDNIFLWLHAESFFHDYVHLFCEQQNQTNIFCNKLTCFYFVIICNFVATVCSTRKCTALIQDSWS